MISPALARKVELLLAEAEETEPVSYSLGTPVLPEGEAVRRLVDLGGEIVPYLIDVSRGEAPGKRHAYVALVLGRLGAEVSREPLRDLHTRYQRREPKDAWDYAVIGQCSRALERLMNGAA